MRLLAGEVVLAVAVAVCSKPVPVFKAATSIAVQMMRCFMDSLLLVDGLLVAFAPIDHAHAQAITRKCIFLFAKSRYNVRTFRRVRPKADLA